MLANKDFQTWILKFWLDDSLLPANQKPWTQESDILPHFVKTPSPNLTSHMLFLLKAFVFNTSYKLMG